MEIIIITSILFLVIILINFYREDNKLLSIKDIRQSKPKISDEIVNESLSDGLKQDYSIKDDTDEISNVTILESSNDDLIEQSNNDLLKKDFCYDEDILNSLHKRKIKYLCHFTSIHNIENILKEGLIARCYLDDYSFEINDDKRLDGRPDCVSLTVEFPNCRYFYKIRQKYKNRIYCVVLLDAVDVLIHTKSPKYFFATNAANSKYNPRYHGSHITPEKFEEMFYFKDSRFPNDVQAEILYDGVIPPICIRKICFNNKKDLEVCIDSFKNKNIYKNNKDLFVIDERFFNQRSLFNEYNEENGQLWQ